MDAAAPTPVPSLWYLITGALLLVAGGVTFMVTTAATPMLAAGVSGGVGIVAFVLAAIAARAERREAAALAVDREYGSVTLDVAPDPTTPTPDPAPVSARTDTSVRVTTDMTALPLVPVICCAECGYTAPGEHTDDDGHHRPMACRSCRTIVETVTPPGSVTTHAAVAAAHVRQEGCARPDLVILPDLARVSCPACGVRALEERLRPVA